jgi:hypothetical protein
MQKERAASALQHGLPVPTPLPKRAPVSGTSNARPRSNPPGGSRSPAAAAASSRRMPLAVKLLGIGLGLLGLVYGLTLLRDRKPIDEPAAADVNPPAAAVK